jgi:NADH:ubiquinone oxidoreductase subunit 6 (subunit J)
MLLFTNNPINAVLFLICIFLNFSILLILLGFNFLGLVFLLIYIGAIAIFFLFILMMINIPIYLKKHSLIKFVLLFSLFLSIFYYFETNVLVNFWLSLKNDFYKPIILSLTYLNDISLYGLFFYYLNWPFFILLAYVLLIAMISSMLIVKKIQFFLK